MRSVSVRSWVRSPLGASWNLGVRQEFRFPCPIWFARHPSMARLAQSAERKALNLVVVGSSPTVGAMSRGCARARARAHACARRRKPGIEPARQNPIGLAGGALPAHKPQPRKIGANRGSKMRGETAAAQQAAATAARPRATARRPARGRRHELHTPVRAGRGEEGLLRELSPGPLAPEARIIPLDQAADVKYRQPIAPSLERHSLVSPRQSIAYMEPCHGLYSRACAP